MNLIRFDSRLMLLVFFFGFSQSILAQYQIGLIPRKSADKGIYHKIGFTEINILYGSPSVNDRTIFGDLVPFNEVWRAGANNATTITFSTDVIIENQPLQKGKYSFFVIPLEGEKWTIIFNKISKQWGAFNYSKKEDALRVKVPVKKINANKEVLEYSITNRDFNNGKIRLQWERILLEFNITVNYIKSFKKDIESKIEKAEDNIKPIIYLQASEHLQQINQEIKLAYQWISTSETLFKQITNWDKSFYPKGYINDHIKWVKANLLAQEKDYKLALKYVNEIKKEKRSNFYEERRAKINTCIKQWEAK